MVESADDILRELAPVLRPALTERKTDALIPASEIPGDADLTQARQKITELLSPNSAPVDELVRQCQLSPALVVTVLLELELAGRIERHPGNRVSLL
ncbi:MAG: hypothetical protein ACREFL_04135 [Stellaceae bacterium]